MKYTIILSLCIFLLPTAYAQELEPTEDAALMTVLVTNMQDTPSKGDIITFVSKKDNKNYQGITSENGKFQILLPKGQTYTVQFKSIETDTDYGIIEVPDQAGIIRFTYTLKYELPKTYILQNVYFDTGKSTLRSNSYTALKNLAELLKNKSTMTIEIAGHTDNVGNDDANKKLSENRAKSVKDYLVKQGIDSNRITTKGYGETQPIAPNSTDEGKQKNRRTEIHIINQ